MGVGVCGGGDLFSFASALRMRVANAFFSTTLLGSRMSEIKGSNFHKCRHNEYGLLKIPGG